MQLKTDWLENIQIYFDNLSVFYAFSVFISIVAVFVSWRYTKNLNEPLDVDSSKEESEDEGLGKDCKNDNDCIQGRIKAAKHRALVDELTANMTSEQLEEEKKVEKAQLSAIFELLKGQQDKFQLSEMKDLEEQLSLYR